MLAGCACGVVGVFCAVLWACAGVLCYACKKINFCRVLAKNKFCVCVLRVCFLKIALITHLRGKTVLCVMRVMWGHGGMGSNFFFSPQKKKNKRVFNHNAITHNLTTHLPM